MSSKVMITGVTELAANAYERPKYDITAIFDQGGADEATLLLEIRKGDDSKFYMTPTGAARLNLMYGLLFNVSPKFFHTASFHNTCPDARSISYEDDLFKGLVMLIELLFKNHGVLGKRARSGVTRNIIGLTDEDLARCEALYTVKGLEMSNRANGVDVFAHSTGSEFRASVNSQELETEFNIHVGI